MLKKKNMFILLILISMMLMAVGVYAADSGVDKNYNHHEEKMEYKKELVEKDYKDGRITRTKRDELIKHFDNMTEFHKENGHLGYCSNSNYENRRYGHGYGHGHRSGGCYR